MQMKFKKTIKFSVEYTVEVLVDENDMVDSNIDIEVPSGAYCGCYYVPNSLKVLSSSKSEINVGDKVYHKTFGEGIVTKIINLDIFNGNSKSIEIDNKNSDYEVNFSKI